MDVPKIALFKILIIIQNFAKNKLFQQILFQLHSELEFPILFDNFRPARVLKIQKVFVCLYFITESNLVDWREEFDGVLWEWNRGPGPRQTGNNQDYYNFFILFYFEIYISV